MRIIDLRPELTPWRLNKSHGASSWRAFDRFLPETHGAHGTYVREIHHYSTHMITFTSTDRETWTADVHTIGHGSATDQRYVNYLTSVYFVDGKLTRDYGWRYTRRGGARVEYVGPETSVTVADVLATWPVVRVSA